MSNTSLCVTALLLPPEGHINILPAPSQTSASHTQTHTETPLQKYKQTLVHILTGRLCCLPLGSIRSQDPGLSPYGGFWSHAQFDFPSASLIKSSWTFLWRWERRREKNKGGRGELLPNFRQVATHCSRRVAQTCPPLSPSIFSPPSPLSLLSSRHSTLEK